MFYPLELSQRQMIYLIDALPHSQMFKIIDVKYQSFLREYTVYKSNPSFISDITKRL